MGYRFSVITLAMATMLLPATADEIPPTDSIPEIVVVATRAPRAVEDLAASVTVLNAEALSNQLAVSVSDAMRYQPAISVPRTGTRFGDGSYVIRGIGGNRVAVEIDGVPVADQFAIGSYSNAGRDLIDVGLIERVEILRGPASTLYGSDAIGGVVAYTTLSPDAFNNDRWRFTGAYRTDSDTGSATLTGGFSGSRLSGLVSWSYRNGGQLNSAALAGDEDHRDSRSNALFAKANWDIGSADRLSASVDVFSRDVISDIRSLLGQGRFRSTTLLAGDDDQQRERYSLVWDAERDSLYAQRIKLLAYRQRSDAHQFTREERASRDLRRTRWFDFNQTASGLELNLQKDLEAFGVQHRLSYGVDFMRADTTESRNGLQSALDGSDPTNTVLGETFPVRDFPISRVRETGVYVHDEISTDAGRLTVIPALRFDQYDLAPRSDDVYATDNPDQSLAAIRDSRWSPKLGLLFKVDAANTVFLQYAQGFRAPPFEDANIGLDIALFKYRALPNPDLRSESSKTYELGWRHSGDRNKFSLTTHFSDYTDFIESKVRLGVDAATGYLLFQSQNLASAHIYGAELEIERALGDITPWLTNVDAKLAAAWTRGSDRQNDQPLASVDPAKLTASLTWSPERWPLSASLHVTAVDRKRRVDDDEQFYGAGYTVVDLLAVYSTGTYQIRAGVFNVFDRTYWRWADVRGLNQGDALLEHLARPGRHAGLALTMNW